jgi:hypothetical protein
MTRSNERYGFRVQCRALRDSIAKNSLRGPALHAFPLFYETSSATLKTILLQVTPPSAF